MKNIVYFFVAQLACILSLSIAGYLAFYDKDGWGWFLFVACLTSVSTKTTKSSSKEDAK
jgi:hypothetical protein